MNTIRLGKPLVLALTAALALAACGKQEPPAAPKPAATPAPAPATPPPAATPAAPATTVTSVSLGNSVGADGKIAAPATTFAPKDTIYAVVATNSTGSGTATVSAKWTYGEGQAVANGEEKISANGPATTTFHIAKPDGWPAGKYAVEISVDGKV
ncbi:MAG TPA: hypothetical protein VF132_12110, partial [Rudaea sp.]